MLRHCLVMGYIGCVLPSAMSTTPLFAQSTVASDAATLAVREPLQSKATAPQRRTARVSLTVRDSTVQYVVHALARQAKMRIVYDTDNPRFSKRITIRLTDTPVMDAIAIALQGTGLSATLTPDGATITIRTQSDTTGAVSPRAQDAHGTLNGRVIDSATKQGIEGATVTIDGTKLADVTQQNGAFSLSRVPVGTRQLIVRRSGYVLQSISVSVDNGKTTTIVVTMRQSLNVLSQVVTTAAGKQYRAEVGNDIARINVDSMLQTAPVRSVTDLLSLARLPGVEVTTTSGNPGAPARIRLRGPGSISQSNDPIVVVDGVRLNPILDRENPAIQTGVADAVLANPKEFVNRLVSSHLDDIDPSSIETIEILRGPSASSLYGTDAANGVIIVTTKRGGGGRTRWTVGYARDWDKLSGQYQPIYKGWGHGNLSEAQVLCGIREALLNICVQDSVSVLNALNQALLTPDAEGRTTKSSVSVQGGTSASNYFLSTTLQNVQGATQMPLVDQIRTRKLGEGVGADQVHPERLQSLIVTSRFTAQPARELDISLSFTGTQTHKKTGKTVFSVLEGPATIGPTDTNTFANVPIVSTQDQGGSKNSSGRAAVTADWRRWPWVKPSVTAGMDRSYRTDDAMTRLRMCTLGPGCTVPNVKRTVFQQEQSSYTVSFRTPLPISLGNLERLVTLQPSVGGNLERSETNATRIEGDSLAPGSEDLATAAVRKIDGMGSGSATAGYYFNMTVGLLQRFYTQVGFRRDIGSALSTRISAPTYPKLTTAWLVSDEPYFPKSALLRTLKLRVAYGHAAVQPKVTDIEGMYVVGSSLINGQILRSVRQSGFGNLRLRPERSVEMELGFDAGLLDNRIDLTATLATKRNRDELVSRPIAASTGLGGSRMENIARVMNRSVEITANNRIIDRPGLTWTADVTFSTQLNRIEELGEGVTSGTGTSRLVEGYPVQSVWAKPLLAFNDVNQDGILTAQEVVVGDSLAYLGWGYPRYKLAYATAVSLFNRRLRITANVAQDVGLTQNMSVYDGRGLQDMHAPIAEKAYGFLAGTAVERYGYRQTVSSLRWNAASVSLEIPEAWSRALRAFSGTISFQGRNLGLWTNYRGRDPAVNANPLTEGLTDNGTIVPTPRKFSASLQLRY